MIGIKVNGWSKRMDFFIGRRNYVSLAKYLDFYVFDECSRNVKICDVIIDMGALWRLHFRLFIRVLSSIKMKFVQVLVKLMTNIFNSFLALLRRLITSSRSFYNFDKMAV